MRFYVLPLAGIALGRPDIETFAIRNRVTGVADWCPVPLPFQSTGEEVIRGSQSIPLELNSVGLSGLVATYSAFSLDVWHPVRLQRLASVYLKCGSSTETLCINSPIQRLHVSEPSPCGTLAVLVAGRQVLSFRIVVRNRSLKLVRWRHVVEVRREVSAVSSICLAANKEFAVVATGREVRTYYHTGQTYWNAQLRSPVVGLFQRDKTSLFTVTEAGLHILNFRSRVIDQNLCVHAWPSSFKVKSVAIKHDRMWMGFEGGNVRQYRLAGDSGANTCEYLESRRNTTTDMLTLISADATKPLSMAPSTLFGNTQSFQLHLEGQVSDPLPSRPLGLHPLLTLHSVSSHTLVVVYPNLLESYYFRMDKQASSHRSFWEKITVKPPLMLLAALVFFLIKHWRAAAHTTPSLPTSPSPYRSADPFFAKSRRKARREAYKETEKSPAEKPTLDSITESLEELCDRLDMGE